LTHHERGKARNPRGKYGGPSLKKKKRGPGMYEERREVHTKSNLF